MEATPLKDRIKFVSIQLYWVYRLSTLDEDVSSGGWRTHSELDSAQLVQQIRSGDQAAEAELYRRFYQPLLNILNHRTRDRSRAEDLLHETIIVVLKKAREGAIQKPEKLASFVQQTAKFVFIGWTRKTENKVDLMDSIDEFPFEAPQVIDEIDKDRKVLLVQRLISEMKVARDSELLSRFYVQDQPKDQICDAMNLSKDQFDRVISRARTRFRSLMQEVPHD